MNSDKKKKNYIHRLVASAFIDNPDNKPQVDHIDNNRSNNHVNNLRWVTNRENQMNSSMGRRNTSGVKGIYFHKQRGKWCARIMINGKNIHIGYFNTLEEAQTARQRVAEQNFGEYLNACERAPIININIENLTINN